jgi:hypothetical protein
MIQTQNLCTDIMLNYYLSQKFKSIKIGEYNHLIKTSILCAFHQNTLAK